MGGGSAREKERVKPTDKVIRGTAIKSPFRTESESIGGAPVRRGSAVPVASETALDGRSDSRRSSIGLRRLKAGEGTGYCKTNWAREEGSIGFVALGI